MKYLLFCFLLCACTKEEKDQQLPDGRWYHLKKHCTESHDDLVPISTGKSVTYTTNHVCDRWHYDTVFTYINCPK